MKTLVWVEHDGKTVKDATLAVVTAASKLGEVHLLVAGQGVDGVAAEAAKIAGVGKVHVADSAALAAAPPTNEADLRSRRATALEESGDVGLSEYLDKAAGERIARALAKAKGNRAEAARSLGIGRATLYRFMRRLGNESIGEPRTNEPSEHQ